MRNPDEFQIPPEQQRLHEILAKTVAYQHSLPDGRAVEMEELRREGVLSPADVDFLAAHSVTYKPHRLSDYHAGDMFHMPTEGGCVFIGPGGPPLKNRHSSVGDFRPIVESFLRLPRPKGELLLHIEFTKRDGMGVAPEMICFNLQSAAWRRRLPELRSAAAEFGLHPIQDEEIQGRWTLIFRVVPDAARTAAAVVALLGRGCGFPDEAEMTYSAGALDEA